MSVSSVSRLSVRGRPSKPLALTLEEGDVDVLVALSESVGRPVLSDVCPVSAKEAREVAKVSAKEAKEAARAAAKKDALAAKEAARAAAKKEKESERDAAKKEKADARDAAKKEKADAREAAKKEKAAAKAVEKKEKAAAKAVEKKEKAAAKAVEKKEKGKAKKPAAQLVAALARADDPVPELLQVEGYEEEEEVSVRVFEWKDKRWLRDDAGAIYDPESHDEVGRWDEESQSVIAMV